MTSQASMIEKLAPRLDRHLVTAIVKFAVENPEDEASKAAYAEALDKLLPKSSPEQVADSLAKAKGKVGPLFNKYFTSEEGRDVVPRFVGRAFGDAADLSKMECKFRLSELGDAKPETNVDALFLYAEALTRAEKFEEACCVLKVYNTLIHNLTNELLSKREDNLRAHSEKAQSEAGVTAKDTSKLQKDNEKIDKDIACLEQRQPASLWGQYMCEVLLGRHHGESRRLLDRIINNVEDDDTTSANGGRLWVLHWGLFHWFKKRDTAAFLELLLNQERVDRSKKYVYANLVQCVAPHLLRYVAVAAILNRKRRKTLRQVARMLESEAYVHTEPVTQFVVELCVHSNFSAAAALLPACEKTLSHDYFCRDLCQEFVTNARQLYFEDQLRIRKSLQIASAAKELGMSTDDAELWLVDLIREAKIDASIDSVGGTVKVKSVATMKSVWQHVMDQLSAVTHHGTSA